MILVSLAPQEAITPSVHRTFAFRSKCFKTTQPLVTIKTTLTRAQNSKKDDQSLDSNKSPANDRTQLPQADTLSPPPPRRRSPVGRDEEDTEKEPDRDLFIPIMVVLALVGYGATAVIAWLEYEGIFTF
jgi:hypothetical protein